MAMSLLSSEDEYSAEEHQGEKQGFFRRYQQGFEHRFERFREGYRRALSAALASSTLFAACFLGFCVVSGQLLFALDRDFFPNVDAPLIRPPFPPPPKLPIQSTPRLPSQTAQLSPTL